MLGVKTIPVRSVQMYELPQPPLDYSRQPNIYEQVFDDGASFETIWSWTKSGNDTHSFPNVQLNSPILFPLPMANLSAMNLQASWSMSPIDTATRANVVYDMFVDPDQNVANSTTDAKYEIMIWIGAFGEPFPLGASVNPFTGVVNKSLPSIDLASTTL